jgi:hypothetical protein
MSFHSIVSWKATVFLKMHKNIVLFLYSNALLHNLPILRNKSAYHVDVFFAQTHLRGIFNTVIVQFLNFGYM